MMKRVFALLLVLSLCLALPISDTALADTGNPVPKAKQAVVTIVSGLTYSADGWYVSYSSGTGFGVGEAGEYADVFVTNCHVIADENMQPYDYAYVCIDGADLFDESTMVKCQVLYADPNVDLAIIQAEQPIQGVTTLPLLPAEEMGTGDSVYALGFPGRTDDIADENLFTTEDITVTDGIVSRYFTSDGVKTMLHTASINHGNSGGPLINELGQVIGINTWGSSDSLVTEDGELNLDYDPEVYYAAIYIDYAMDALDQLELPYTVGSLEEEAAEETTQPVSAEPVQGEPDTGSSDQSGTAQAGPSRVLVIGGIAAVIFLTAGVVVAVMLTRKNKKPSAVGYGAAPVPPSAMAPAMPPYAVYAMAGPLQGRSWPLTQPLVVGRDPGCSIVLPPETNGVSRRHCQISLQGGSPMLMDLGSAHGTFLNGSRLAPNVSVSLPENAEILLGSRNVILILQRKREVY